MSATVGSLLLGFPSPPAGGPQGRTATDRFWGMHRWDPTSHLRTRRLVPREPQCGLTFDVTFEQPRRLSTRPRILHSVADVLDLSLDGALIRLAGRVELATRDCIALRANPGGAVGEIRHTIPVSPHASRSFYGIRFIGADDAFRAAIDRQLNENRQGLIEAWQNAR